MSTMDMPTRMMRTTTRCGPDRASPLTDPAVATEHYGFTSSKVTGGNRRARGISCGL